MEKEKKQIWFEASISFNLRKYTRTHNGICVVREKKIIINSIAHIIITPRKNKMFFFLIALTAKRLFFIHNLI